MDLTVSSVLTMVFFCSILIGALCLLFKSNHVLNAIGPNSMILIFVAIMVRMLAPFEFFFTYDWDVYDILNPFWAIFSRELIAEPVQLKVKHLVFGVWALGIVYCMVKNLVTYRRVSRVVSLLPELDWDGLVETYRLDVDKYEGIRRIKLVSSGQFTSPYLIGVKHPYLVLPAIAYKEKEFKYIILHELMHVRHHDIVWKIIIDLLCSFFWWNPLLYYLRKELFRLVEMRNDMRILAMLTPEEEVAYMQCLKGIATTLAGKEMAFGVSFSRNNLKELSRRMRLMVSGNAFNCKVQRVLYLLAGMLIIATTAVIIEPDLTHVDPEIGILATEFNTYLIRVGEQYDVYVNGQYMERVDELTGFGEVPIYESLEEYYEEH